MTGKLGNRTRPKMNRFEARTLAISAFLLEVDLSSRISRTLLKPLDSLSSVGVDWRAYGFDELLYEEDAW